MACISAARMSVVRRNILACVMNGLKGGTYSAEEPEWPTGKVKEISMVPLSCRYPSNSL